MQHPAFHALIKNLCYRDFILLAGNSNKMGKIFENYPLSHLNTFGIEACARFFTEVSSLDDIQEFFNNKQLRGLPLFILGGGSNVLLTRDFGGVVMKINIAGKTVVKEDEDYVYLKSGAGENWHRLVAFCVENGYYGVENLSLIPGCTGAAPMQNIGAYGAELKDVFYELEALMTGSGEVKKFLNEECRFGYRESIFKNELKGKCIILSVTLKLSKKPSFNTSYGAIEEELKAMNVTELSIKAVSEAVCRIRKSKLPDPAVIGNAGSFFKNPTVSKEKFEELKKVFPGMVAYPSAVPDETGHGQAGKKEPGWKLAAGWLIEKAGWKGKRFDGYGVHEKQALVLVNYGGAKGEDIYLLSQKIMEDIKEKFGVALEREVNII